MPWSTCKMGKELELLPRPDCIQVAAVMRGRARKPKLESPRRKVLQVELEEVLGVTPGDGERVVVEDPTIFHAFLGVPGSARIDRKPRDWAWSRLDPSEGPDDTMTGEGKITGPRSRKRIQALCVAYDCYVLVTPAGRSTRRIPTPRRCPTIHHRNPETDRLVEARR